MHHNLPGIVLYIIVYFYFYFYFLTFGFPNVCRLRMRIIKTRTERGRPGTEATHDRTNFGIGERFVVSARADLVSRDKRYCDRKGDNA